MPRGAYNGQGNVTPHMLLNPVFVQPPGLYAVKFYEVGDTRTSHFNLWIKDEFLQYFTLDNTPAAVDPVRCLDMLRIRWNTVGR